MSAPTHNRQERMTRGQAWLLAAVAGAALVARVPFLRDGLPDYPHVDEVFTVQSSLQVASGSLNPHFFDWPGTLLFNVNAALFRVTLLFGASAKPAHFFLVARVVDVAFALGTVALVFFMTRRLGKLAAACAALVVAFATLHVTQSTLAMTDVPATFFLTAAMFLAVDGADQHRARRFFAAGLVGGLGCAVKYYVGVVGVGMVVAACLSPARGSKKLGLVAAAAVGGLLGFALGCPWCLLAFAEFKSAFVAQFAHQSGGHLGAETDHWTLLAPAVGWPAVVVAAAGALASFRRGYRKFLPVAATLLVYFAVASASQVSFPRYAVPEVPMLAVLVAVALAFAAELSVRLRWLAGAVALGVVAVPLWSTAEEGYARTLPDTRVLAAEWLREQGLLTKPVIRTFGGPAVAADPVIAPFNPFPASAWERLHSGDCRCVVLDSNSIQRFYGPAADQNHPERAGPHREFYDYVREHWDLAAEFRPAKNARGPRVEVFTTPQRDEK